MEAGCSALVSDLDDLKLTLKNSRDDYDDSWDDDDESNNSFVGFDGKKVPYTIAKKDQAGFSEVWKLLGTAPVDVEMSPLQLGTAPVDVEMRAAQVDLMFANKDQPAHWLDLYCAIDKGNVDALIAGLNKGNKELLRHQDSRGETLLHASVKASRRGPLRKLVRFMKSNHMTDAMCLENKNGDTALHLAIKRGDRDASNCLMDAEPKTVYQVNRKGVSPLYMAVKAGNHELIKSMVSYCCLRDHASEILSKPNHDTLAHLAIDAGSFGIFKVLMEHLPTLGKAKNENGWRLLSYAAYKGSLDEVTYILTNFPKYAEKYDNDGSLPIHNAMGGGQVSVVEAFLEHCPQALHHVSKNGRSVLHIAAINDKTEIITYLKENVKMDESFLNLKDNKGKTFMDYAKDRKQ